MNGYVRVVNSRVDMAPDSQPEDDEIVIPVDRRNAILGNKHVLRNKLDRQERDRVIAAYEADLVADFAVKGPMYREIREMALRVIEGERLAIQCVCRPLRCHADLIEQRINTMVAAHKEGREF